MNAKISRLLLAASVVLFPAGCASTGSTLGSGVGDAYVEHPPFYAGLPARSLEPSEPLGIFAVVYQRGASQPELFDPEQTDDVQALLRDMNAFLAAADLGTLLGDGAVEDDGARRIAPDVRFGCPTGSGDPQEECAEREGEVLGRGPQPMKLAVGRPSAAWITWSDSVMAGAGVDHALVLTLEVGQYRVRQSGWRGTKVVELGTDHEATLPWLTALDGPVSVLQLTGAVVGRDGKALRIGAEGLAVRRTGIGVSALGGQELVTEEEVRQLRTARRDDLPGRPLVWEAGLKALVEQLTGRPLAAMHVQGG